MQASQLCQVKVKVEVRIYHQHCLASKMGPRLGEPAPGSQQDLLSRNLYLRSLRETLGEVHQKTLQQLALVKSIDDYVADAAIYNSPHAILNEGHIKKGQQGLGAAVSKWGEPAAKASREDHRYTIGEVIS
jgi:hypothetical protein